MISSKHLTKIAIMLISLVLIFCVIAMCFFDKLFVTTNNSGYSMEYEDALFDTSKIIDINIEMDSEKWGEMLQNAMQEEYFECDVTINGTTFSQVGIRPKGNTSLSSIANDPDNNRYSFKLEFDQFVDGQTCFGLDKLILNNSYADTTNMKEAVIYDMFKFLDADASLYNYATISVNGEYFGVYLALEAVEDSFMLRNYGTQIGYLYKPDSMNHNANGDENKGKGNNMPAPPEGGFQVLENFEGVPQNGQFNPKPENEDAVNEKQNQDGASAIPNESERLSNRREFADGGKRMGRGGMPGGNGSGANLNYTNDDLDSYSTIWDGQVNDSKETDHKRVVTALKNINERNDIERYIDVEQILKYMAVHNFSVNDDSLSGGMAHNYYLYESNGQISILPWDYNLALGGMHGGTGTSVINEPIDDRYNSTELFDFVLENEEYKARYHEYYNKLVEEYIGGGKFDETYQRIRTQIDTLVKADPNTMYSYEEYTKGTEVLYEIVKLRAKSVKEQLDGTIPSTSEGQKEDNTALIDGSHINISDMGMFMGGGGRGGEPQMPGGNNKPPEEQKQ